MYTSPFFYSNMGFKSILIKDSILENIYINSTIPLIESCGLTMEYGIIFIFLFSFFFFLIVIAYIHIYIYSYIFIFLYYRIENSTFFNCHSEFGYLFFLKKTTNDNYVKIKNSTFIGNFKL